MPLFQALNTIFQMLTSSNPSPVSGQVWFDGTNMLVNLNGTTYQLNQNIKNTAHGTATLTAGSVTVTNSLVTANSIIMCTPITLGTITGPVGLGATTRTAGTSFTIKSENALDTSTVQWIMFEP